MELDNLAVLSGPAAGAGTRGGPPVPRLPGDRGTGTVGGGVPRVRAGPRFDSADRNYPNLRISVKKLLELAVMYARSIIS